MKAGEQRQPAFLKLSPMGKVPAILCGDVLVTEQVAIGLYLAELFPEAGITPAVSDALRGPYLRWYVFYAACFEPALVDKALKREPGPSRMVPYGDLETTLKTLESQLSVGPWMLGERFTAVDVLWGTALTWMTGFGLVEATAANVGDRAGPRHPAPSASFKNLMIFDLLLGVALLHPSSLLLLGPILDHFATPFGGDDVMYYGAFNAKAITSSYQDGVAFDGRAGVSAARCGQPIRPHADARALRAPARRSSGACRRPRHRRGASLAGNRERTGTGTAAPLR